MSRVRELKIGASNLLVPNRIVIRMDSFENEVGIIALPRYEEDLDKTRAVYVYKRDLPELILGLFEFFMQFANEIEIATLFTSISKKYTKRMNPKGDE